MSRVRTVRSREYFLNLSVAESCNFDAMRHPPVPTNKNSLQSDGIQTSSVRCGMFQFYRTPDNPRQATNLVSLSLLATSHIQLVPKQCVFPAQSVPPRRSVQALFGCCGCRFRLRVLLHQATDTQVHSLGARDIEYHVSGTNTLFDKTVRVRIIGSSFGVKDCEGPSANHQLRP